MFEMTPVTKWWKLICSCQCQPWPLSPASALHLSSSPQSIKYQASQPTCDKNIPCRASVSRRAVRVSPLPALLLCLCSGLAEAAWDWQLSGCIIITRWSVSVCSDVSALMAPTQLNVHGPPLPLLTIIPQQFKSENIPFFSLSSHFRRRSARRVSDNSEVNCLFVNSSPPPLLSLLAKQMMFFCFT